MNDVRVAGIIPIELNDRLEAIAKRRNVPTDQFIGYLISEVAAKHFAEMEADTDA